MNNHDDELAKAIEALEKDIKDCEPSHPKYIIPVFYCDLDGAITAAKRVPELEAKLLFATQEADASRECIKIFKKEQDMANQRIGELKDKLVQRERDIQLLLSELDGIYTGLMMHPDNADFSGFCISVPSKEKLKSLQEIIKRYEQP